MEKMLNVCVVGCGGMAKNYLHRYTGVQGVRLHLVIDINETKARSMAERFPTVHWSTSFEDALAADIDIVDISTPNDLHAYQTIRALRAGKHVIVQKPLAPNVEEAKEMVWTARQSGKSAGMYMSMLDNPLYHDIKAMIGSGVLGTVTAVHCRGAHRGGLKLQPDSWRTSVSKTGGGSFVQLTSHYLHLAQWLLDSSICKVAAISKNRMCKSMEGDDVTAAVCDFADGTVGTFESSYNADGYQLSIYGSGGYVSVRGEDKVRIKLDTPYLGDSIRYETPNQELDLDFGFTSNSLYFTENMYDQHEAYLQAILNKRKIPVSVEEGLRDLKIITAVYLSAKEERFVYLDEIKS